jgi:hypothetical protein
MPVPDEIAGEPAPDHGSGEDLGRTIGRLLDSQLSAVLCMHRGSNPCLPATTRHSNTTT